MKRTALKFLAAYAALLVAFVLLKPPFLLAYTRAGAAGWAAVWHGLPMDMCMAGYFAIIPALLLIAESIAGPRVLLRRIACIYYAIAAVLIAAVAVLDFGLYAHWGFRLDATPLFYFFSSPASAMASATTAETVGGIVAWVLLSAAFFALFYYVAVEWPRPVRKSKGGCAVAVLLAALLFLPIRGGVTVSTMNLSRAYFSDDMTLNHAAINPAFSLMYSLTHRDDFGSMFRFFDNEEARAMLAELRSGDAGAAEAWLNTERPDVYLIIFESCSAHLLPSLGGDSIAMRLDSLAARGVLFDRMYASSFRTDRAIPAILSGLPGQPTESLMKHVAKAEQLPSIAAALGREGYDCRYYYGGDANFTNMLAYLRASGFGTVVSDKDFPLAERASKWGAPDHAVFRRALADARVASDAPRFVVVQTSSSHEPYDVPYDNPRFPEGPQRAFAYADSCIGAFVDSLSALPSWSRTLVAVVPDHYGCYPPRPAEIEARHHVPFVLAGGVLRPEGTRVHKLASQTDIAATLLGQLGVPADEFIFSRNLAVPDSLDGGFAFFSEPEEAAFISPDGMAVLNVATGESAGGERDGRLVKAYLQTLYNYIDSL